MARKVCATVSWFLAISLPIGLYVGKQHLAQDPFGGASVLKRSYKDKEGKSVSSSIHISTDKNGFKYVEAETMEDAFYGEGFCHCRDRLWQMNFSRALSQGKLSEILGPDLLDIDMYFRQTDLRAVANMHMRNLNQEDRRTIDAYVEGVNFCAANLKVLPVEFYMLWTDFRSWTAEDVMITRKFLDYVSSFDAQLELARDRLAEVYPVSLVQRIFPYRMEDQYHKELGAIMTQEEMKRQGFYDDSRDIYNVPDDLLAYPRNADGSFKSAEDLKDAYIDEESNTVGGSNGYAQQGASNCWAVSGEHTQTGKPMLTCDPHLFKFSNVQWYFMHLKWADNFVLGAVIPGMLHFTYARSKYISYGMTSMNADS